MKIVGLITEYNPFHNGHLYHIQKRNVLPGRYSHRRHERRLRTARCARHHAKTSARRDGFKMRGFRCIRDSCMLCLRKCGIFRHGRRIPPKRSRNC